MHRILTPAAVLLFGVTLDAQTTIYNSVPTPLPRSLTSKSFEAGYISEFGNLVSFGGTDRRLVSVKVAMVTWAYFSKDNAPGTPNTGGWTDPAITLNLYAANNSVPGQPAPGNLIATVTQPFFIPWRPEPSPLCGVGSTLWYASDGCHNGMAFEIVFDFSSLSLTLPDQLIFGIAYNTQIAGQPPTGVTGPYNDLNVGLSAIPPSPGTNPFPQSAYLNGIIGQAYADNGAGGIQVFRLDVGGTHTPVAIEFNPPTENITVIGGGIQSTTINTQFGSVLQAKVADVGGVALPGVVVTFAVPASGASATLPATSVVTDSTGVANVTATANSIAGAYAVTAVTAPVAAVTPTATFNLTNLAGPAETIAFVQQPTDTQAGRTIIHQFQYRRPLDSISGQWLLESGAALPSFHFGSIVDSPGSAK